MPQSKSWIVTTSSSRPIAEIADELKGLGFSIGQVLEEVGSITGQAGDDAITRAKSIAGVVDVSPDAPIDIGPPDSPDTW
jgi:hypothetical protein